MASRSFDEIERELVANLLCPYSVGDSKGLVDELFKLANLFYHEQIPKALALKYIVDFRKMYSTIHLDKGNFEHISKFMFEHRATINASQGREVMYSNPAQAYTIAVKTYRMACAKLNIPVLHSFKPFPGERNPKTFHVRKRQEA